MIIRYFLEILTIMFVGFSIVSVAYAQNATPPAVAPTVSQSPVDTSPTPNFQYLPQKAYVQPFKPEVGIPSNSIPLTAVPQVIPAQPVQQAAPAVGIPGIDIAAILALVGAGGAYLKGHLANNKANKVEETSREQSSQIVKGASVDESLARQMYENMPDKGTSINDKPEIQLKSLADNQAEAVKTATEA